MALIWVNLAIKSDPLFLPRSEPLVDASGKMTLFIFPELQFAPRVFEIFSIRSLAHCAVAEKVQIGPSVFVSGRKVHFGPPACCWLQNHVPEFLFASNSPEIAFFYFSAQKPKTYQSMQILGIFLYKIYAKR